METAPDSQEINGVQQGRDMPATDTGGVNHGKLNLGTSSSNGVSREVSTPAGHVTNNVQPGPVKPMTKWTRVPRMDCGLEHGGEVKSLPALGKRGLA